MKLFRSSLLMMGELAAFGWFILSDIAFIAVLPLIPLGILFYYLHHVEAGRLQWLDSGITLVGIFISAFLVSRGLFEGRGFWMLCFLALAVSLGATRAPIGELERISGWWMTAFLLVFVAMLIATIPGIEKRESLPHWGNATDIIIFYLLAFLEPLSLGKDYRAGPLALGILLIPFATLSFLALGSGAFGMAEFPYLSVWSGVSISAFHHTEGIILCLYFGAVVLRASHLVSDFSFAYRNKKQTE